MVKQIPNLYRNFAHGVFLILLQDWVRQNPNNGLSNSYKDGFIVLANEHVDSNVSLRVELLMVEGVVQTGTGPREPHHQIVANGVTFIALDRFGLLKLHLGRTVRVICRQRQLFVESGDNA